MFRAEIKPIWTSSSFLVYAGGLTVLGGAAAGLGYLASQSGSAAITAWALLFLVIVYGLALALLAGDRWLPAGILAFVSVLLWGAFIVYLFKWFGWNSVDAPLGDWSLPKMLLWILVLASASFDQRLFKFPFIAAISVVVFYFLVVDVLTSGHGNWFAFVTLSMGFLYFLIGIAIDAPSTFWLHLAGGAFIGGALLKWFHTSDFDFALISIFAVAFVLVGYATRRSSWAVYGTIGFFIATVHYLVGSPTQIAQEGLNQLQCLNAGHDKTMPGLCSTLGPHISPWAPALAFGLLGFWLLLLGMLGRRRREATAVVVTTEPVVE